MNTNKFPEEVDNETPAPLDAPHEAISAWELVGTGRYRPRRIRGSFRGRELG